MYTLVHHHTCKIIMQEWMIVYCKKRHDAFMPAMILIFDCANPDLNTTSHDQTFIGNPFLSTTPDTYQCPQFHIWVQKNYYFTKASFLFCKSVFLGTGIEVKKKKGWQTLFIEEHFQYIYEVAGSCKTGKRSQDSSAGTLVIIRPVDAEWANPPLSHVYDKWLMQSFVG